MYMYQWKDIKNHFSDCLLLVGNGASIAIDQRFSYNSLFEEAKKSGFFSPEVVQLFRNFNTQDFEYILRMLDHSYRVNEALGVDVQKTIQVYKNTREALIEIIRKIHITYNEAWQHLHKIVQYLKQFETIISLNYDLTIYGALLFAHELDTLVQFKDCFRGGEFDSEWERFREPIPPSRRSILVFYPHGNLVLATNLQGNTTKISRQANNENLIDQIFKKWKSRELYPLFVSEGESVHKENAIIRNVYLNTVYKSVLPKAGKSIVIYGWSMNDNDDHILRALLKSEVQRIAVSVYMKNNNWQDYCGRVEVKIKNMSRHRNIEILFYNSNSEECWNN